MPEMSNVRGFNSISDLMAHGNKDIQALQHDIASASGLKGTLEGHTAHWKPDAHSLLQDMAEESGLMFGGKLAGRLKKTNDRQKKLDMIKEKALHYIEQVPDLGPTTKKLRTFLEHLHVMKHNPRIAMKARKRKNRSNAANEDFEAFDDIMDLVNEHFPVSALEAAAKGDSDSHTIIDPTLQYAALAFARDVMEDEEKGQGGGTMSKDLQAGMDKLMENHGEAIRAGMNISATAQEHSQNTKAKTADLRHLYQEIILPQQDLEKSYQSIAKRVKELPFADAVNYLIAAAGKELSCANPSVSPALIQSSLNDIKRLQNLTSIYENSAGFLLNLKQKFEIAGDVKAEDFFCRTLELFTQRWTAKNVLERMRNQLGIVNIPPHLFFLNSFMQMMKFADEQCFARKEDREVFTAAIQDQLDNVISKEECLSPIVNI